jgi:hypothetical protein
MDFLLVVFVYTVVMCAVAWLVGSAISYGMGDDE